MNINTLTNKSAFWPNQFDNTYPPIKQLYISGDVPDLPRVGVIGTRRPTSYGRLASERIVSELSQAGVCIVSGMAIGIDSCSHIAALEAGGTTIAVLPSIIERPYPARHRSLAARIAKSGALISEYGDGSEVHKSNFIARNRIIAALSDFLLVIEASHKSGTMHTVRFSLALGAEVGAIPGPIDHINSTGTNDLLKNGAHVITQAKDILDIMGIETQKAILPTLTDQEAAIRRHLMEGPSSVSQMASSLKLESSELLVAITGLEIHKLIAQAQDGMYALR